MVGLTDHSAKELLSTIQISDESIIQIPTVIKITLTCIFWVTVDVGQVFQFRHQLLCLVIFLCLEICLWLAIFLWLGIFLWLENLWVYDSVQEKRLVMTFSFIIFFLPVEHRS